MLFANVERGDIMVVVGVTRRIDDLGRITIPSEIRKTYQLDKNDPVEIIGTEDGILLRVPNIRIASRFWNTLMMRCEHICMTPLIWLLFMPTLK